MKSIGKKVGIIGGGFAGLTAAYELSKRGIAVTVFEADSAVGGLAGTFDVQGERLEKFYHHWFNNDLHVLDLARELGLGDRILTRFSRTGMYFNKNFFKLSTPMDVLRFTPLPFFDRIRLGLLALKARKVKDWRSLESLTAEEWLIQLGGKKVYEVVWKPLLDGKFGPYASKVSAVWFWNKLKLRGGSRGSGGAEELVYFKGGFTAITDALVAAIEKNGGQVLLSTPVQGVEVQGGKVCGVKTAAGTTPVDAVIATPALPMIADWLAPHTSADYAKQLRSIEYIANVCLVLELDRSLSSTYWLNVNDPGFPFVGVIEHTNFEPTSTYGGRHIVYLSKYLPESDHLYQMSDTEFRDFCVTHLQRMFPEFKTEGILQSHTWRATHSQPIVAKHYSQMIPAEQSPVEGFYICTMAQIYPEDRGTNYAVREGRKVGQMLADKLAS